ncbi:MAG: phenylacetic acid degradation bifunctional protein PaaZ [Parvularculaceae bacterium]
MHLANYAIGDWRESTEDAREIASAVTGATVATASTAGLDFKGMLEYARNVGGPNLRKLTFHDRGHMLKALAVYLNSRKEELYALNPHTGATRKDGWIDIDGGIGTLFVFSSKARREMPDDQVFVEGATEQISREGTFLGQHVCTPLQGAAIHINAFNFPVWGMLEKFGPAFIAGVPAIVKPATATSYLAEACVRIMIESGILPEGALQLICGGVGDLLDHVTCQDVISFTGSIDTAQKLERHPAVVANTTRFIAERDSLNCSILGPDATPDAPEFDLFVKEVVREMTVKAGQKCTAIRRALVPAHLQDAVIEALQARLAKTVVGDPSNENVRMGALASLDQRRDVLEKIEMLKRENEIVFGDPENFEIVGADKDKGAFLPPILFKCSDPLVKTLAHSVEPFGPVSTVMPYRDLDEAVRIANMGEGSLVASLFTHDGQVAREVVLGAGAFHGRIAVIDRDSAKESTGHGSPLPHLVHGGPGRAGGGEEMGGVRGVMHYMQRTALQGSPRVLTAVTNRWVRGAEEVEGPEHPFRRHFEDLAIGETFRSPAREVTMADIEHFAEFTGDKFYAHMDEEAAAANPFFEGRVAHGYLLLSFAAGLFVDPAPGPVLANYGLDNLRFMQPVYPGDEVKVRLTVKQKTPRKDEYGEVRWDVEMTNGEDEIVAAYDLLTMNARKDAA